MITVILTIALVGLIVWALIQFVPMPQPFQKVIIAVALILCILYALRHLGIGL